MAEQAIQRQRTSKNKGRNILRGTAGLLVFGMLSLPAASTRVYAAPVPKQAVQYYQTGLQIRKSNPQQAIADFDKAIKIDPTWVLPWYEKGIVLSTLNFQKSIPVLLHTFALDKTNDTVWNILGWGYYSQKNYVKAEAAFTTQLSVKRNNPAAWWGLANVYMNSSIRRFSDARKYLTLLAKDGTYGAKARHALGNLPPAAVDATYQPNQPITTEDAIAMMLSYRSFHATKTSDYVAYAKAHHLLDGYSVPALPTPATRLFLARLLTKYYGVDAFEYIRPFAFTDITALSTTDQMFIQSAISTGLLTATSAAQFNPDGTMTRGAFAQVVAHANQLLKNGTLDPTKYLAPPAPPVHNPSIYFFNTSTPDYNTQTQDILANQQSIAAILLTAYPWFKEFPAGAAKTRQAVDGTQFLLTPMSAGTGQTTQYQTLSKSKVPLFMVLGNYNYVTSKSDASLVHQLLQSPDEESALIKEMMQIATSEHLTGITVDFENMYGEDRAAYVSFLAQVHQAAQTNNLTTMICLPERDTDDPSSAYDYQALAANADLAMLITYDEHTPGSKPGPISNIQNTDRVVKYAITQMPVSKVLVGVADYGYDWTSTAKATEVSMAEAESLAASHHVQIQWDAASQTPHFTYTDQSGQTHQVWFENGQSMNSLHQLVNQYGVDGISVWHIGAENAEFWQAWTGAQGQTSKS